MIPIGLKANFAHQNEYLRSQIFHRLQYGAGGRRPDQLRGRNCFGITLHMLQPKITQYSGFSHTVAVAWGIVYKLPSWKNNVRPEKLSGALLPNE